MDGVSSPAAATLFDTLHYDRCGSTLEDIEAIPQSRINYFQLCDGPADYDHSDAGMMWLARNKRMIPGRGDIDFAPILARLPYDVTISVEVPDRELSTGMGLAAFAKTALEETRSIVDEATAGNGEKGASQ